jgi:hypothetical protein
MSRARVRVLMAKLANASAGFWPTLGLEVTCPVLLGGTMSGSGDCSLSALAAAEWVELPEIKMPLSQACALPTRRDAAFGSRPSVRDREAPNPGTQARSFFLEPRKY